MPNDYVDRVVKDFRKCMTSEYDLDKEVVVSLCEMLRTSLKKVSPPTSRRARGGKTRQRRRKSAYNVYVREMMKDADIKALGHKDKMAAIGSRWKDLNDGDKEPYKTIASDENTKDEEAAAATLAAASEAVAETSAETSAEAEETSA